MLADRCGYAVANFLAPLCVSNKLMFRKSQKYTIFSMVKLTVVLNEKYQQP